MCVLKKVNVSFIHVIYYFAHHSILLEYTLLKCMWIIVLLQQLLINLTLLAAITTLL